MRNHDHTRRLIEPSDYAPQGAFCPFYVSRCANWIFTRNTRSESGEASVKPHGSLISNRSWVKIKIQLACARTLRWARVCKPPVRGSFIPHSHFSSFFIPSFFFSIPPSTLFRRTFTLSVSFDSYRILGFVVGAHTISSLSLSYRSILQIEGAACTFVMLIDS